MLPVVWSVRFEKDFAAVANYLFENLGVNKVQEVHDEIVSITNQISLMLEMFPPTKKKAKTRYAVVTTQLTIFYKIHKKEITLITLFDTRQNPSKRKL